MTDFLSIDPSKSPPAKCLPWRRWFTLSSPLILLLALIAYCGHTYLPIARAATDLFHGRFASGQDDLIYQESDRAFRAALTPDAERSYFNRVRRKLGACAYTGPLGWGINTNTGGTFVSLTYRAHCHNGNMRESFNWRLTGGHAVLVGYRVESALLLAD